MANEPERKPERQDEAVLEIHLRQMTAQMSRRQVIGLLGAGAAATVLAACGGDSATATTGSSGATTAAGGGATTAAAGGGATTAAAGGGATQAGGDLISSMNNTAAPKNKGGQYNGGVNYELPPTGHFNFYVTKQLIEGHYNELIHPAMCFYLWAEDKYLPVLAEKWGFEGGENFSVTLKQGLKWDDGKPLNSKDVINTFTARKLYNGQMFQYVDKFEAKDDQTVVFHMNVPSTIVQRYVLRERIMPQSVYGQFTDKAYPLYQQGKTRDDAEIKAIRGEFDQFRPTEYPASGPYKLDRQSLTEASCEFVRNPNGVNADIARIDKMKFYVGETPIATPLVLGKEMDFNTNGLAVATDRQLQSTGVRVLRTGVHSGPAIHFNYARTEPKMKILQDKRVRQAFAHAVKREDNAAFSLAQSAKAIKYMNGVADSVTEKWISKADLDKHNQYPFDQAKATQLLQAAGCKKEGNVWKTPDGAEMRYDLIEPAEFQDWSAASQDWGDQMTKFGIPITVRAITFTQIPVERREGRFELAIDGFGAGNPHPRFHWESSLLNKVQPLANGPYMSFDLKQKTDVVGDVDFQQLITDSALGLDVEKQKANITKAALAYNELLPTITLWERYLNGPALEGVRVTGWPKDGHPIFENDIYNDSYAVILLYNGTLGPK